MFSFETDPIRVFEGWGLGIYFTYVCSFLSQSNDDWEVFALNIKNNKRICIQWRFCKLRTDGLTFLFEKQDPDEKQSLNNWIDVVIYRNEDFFLNIKLLSQIFATHPVTVATNWRSFSTCRRREAYQRNTVGVNRPNGLTFVDR